MKPHWSDKSWEVAIVVAILCCVAMCVIRIIRDAKDEAQRQPTEIIYATPVGDDGRQPGLMVPCRVIEVYDGDTITVEATVKTRVRLLDCWAPEVRGGTPETKRAGLASRDHLRTLVGSNPSAIMMVPLPADGDIGKMWHLGRLLGDVMIDGQTSSLSDQQVKAGHATRAKP